MNNIRTLVTLFAALFAFTAVAQDQSDAEIKALIQKRAELINVAKSTPRISELMKLHLNDFKLINTTYTPDGESSRRESDMAALKRVLSHYSDAGDQQYTVTVTDIPYTKVYDKSAIAIFTTGYQMKNNWTDEEMYSGEQIITANFKKTPDGWKFKDMYVTELRTSISRYPCGYELYQKDANELLVNVKVPAGSRFQNEYIDIRFTETRPQVFSINTDRGDEFFWENGALRSAISNDASAIIARPTSKTGVCENIIMFYHGDVCSGTRLQK